MGMKLSEAVEMKSYDVLPEVKPEDVEVNVNTVAAVSEPFADARIRNAKARETFKQMIAAKTEQAKGVLNLDDQLKGRQANGNGKLVEAADIKDPITRAFIDAKWNALDIAQSSLKNNLPEIKIKSSDSLKFMAALSAVDNYLNQEFINTFKGAEEIYRSKIKEITESRQILEKITLDENLFENFEEEHVGKSSKRDFISKKKPSIKTPIKEAVAVKVDVRDYKPWNGATIAYNRIQEEGKLDYLFQLLEEIYPDGIDVQALNDLLWFDREWLYQMLDIKDGNGEPEEGDEE